MCGVVFERARTCLVAAAARAAWVGPGLLRARRAWCGHGVCGWEWVARRPLAPCGMECVG